MKKNEDVEIITEFQKVHMELNRYHIEIDNYFKTVDKEVTQTFTCRILFVNQRNVILALEIQLFRK